VSSGIDTGPLRTVVAVEFIGQFLYGAVRVKQRLDRLVRDFHFQLFLQMHDKLHKVKGVVRHRVEEGPFFRTGNL
jgi:hypothetical protein